MCARGTVLILLLALGVAAPSEGARARRTGASTAPRRAAAPTAAQSRQVVDAVLSLIVDRIWERGDYYWHQGRYTDRIATDRLVIRMDPTFTEAYSTAGFLLENTGREEEARRMYTRATQVAPHAWSPWHELGWFYSQRKRYAEAIRAYEKAVQQKGAPTFVWKNLAHNYEKAGNLQKALETWERVRYLDAADGAIDINVARIEKRLEEERSRGGRN